MISAQQYDNLQSAATKPNVNDTATFITFYEKFIKINDQPIIFNLYGQNGEVTV